MNRRYNKGASAEAPFYLLSCLADLASPLLSCLADLAGLFVSPAWLQRQRPVELECARSRAVKCAAAAIPALVRVEDERRLTFRRVRDKHVDLAGLYAGVAPDAFFRIDPDRHARCLYIRHRINLVIHRSFLLSSFIYAGIIRVVCLILFLHITPVADRDALEADLVVF